GFDPYPSRTSAVPPVPAQVQPPPHAFFSGCAQHRRCAEETRLAALLGVGFTALRVRSKSVAARNAPHPIAGPALDRASWLRGYSSILGFHDRNSRLCRPGGGNDADGPYRGIHRSSA